MSFWADLRGVVGIIWWRLLVVLAAMIALGEVMVFTWPELLWQIAIGNAVVCGLLSSWLTWCAIGTVRARHELEEFQRLVDRLQGDFPPEGPAR